MVSRDAYASKGIKPWSIVFATEELAPKDILDKALAGKILSEVFYLKPDEDSLINNGGKRTLKTYVGTQCILFDFDDASCDIDEFVSRLTIKPTFGYTTLSDGKVEGGKVWHKFRLGYVLSDFVYGQDNRYRIWKDIAKANGFLPTLVDGKAIKGEQDKCDMNCSSTQWFFGTDEKARTIFFPDNIIKVKPEIKGMPRTDEEYEKLRSESELEYKERRRKIEGDKTFWDDGRMYCIYKQVLSGYGWTTIDWSSGIERMPYFDVEIKGRKMAMKVCDTNTDGSPVKDNEGNPVYLRRTVRENDREKVKYIYKYRTVKFTNGQHRRSKIYVACQKIKENYLKLREKDGYTPELTPTILFYFTHLYANTNFELKHPIDTISSNEIADIVLNVFDDGRGASFFNKSVRAKKRVSMIIDKERFGWDSTNRQKTALFTAQIRMEDIFLNYDWKASPSENIARLNGNGEDKMYAGQRLSENSIKKYFSDIRRALAGDGKYTNTRGKVIYDFNKFNSISKDIIESFISYFDFSFSSFFKVSKANGGHAKRGEKRRLVMEALKEIEGRHSVRETMAILRERGISVSRGTVAEILKGTPVQIQDTLSVYNYRIDNISCSLNENGHPVPLRLLSEGKTIKEIANILNINEKTIKRYIKKAKDEGILTNKGSKKYPKWVITKMDSVPLRNDEIGHPDTLKENEIGHHVPLKNEEKKERGMKPVIINGWVWTPADNYTDEDFINDTMPSITSTSFRPGMDDIPVDYRHVSHIVQLPPQHIAPPQAQLIKPVETPPIKISMMEKYRSLESTGMDSKEIGGLRERLSKLIV